MASYPTTGNFKPSTASEISYTGDLVVDTTLSGKTRVRSMADAIYRVFNLKYNIITNTERLTLESFYTTNRAQTFQYSYAWYGEAPSSVPTYACAFLEAPKFQALGGIYWSAEVRMIQVT